MDIDFTEPRKCPVPMTGWMPASNGRDLIRLEPGFPLFSKSTIRCQLLLAMEHRFTNGRRSGRT